MDYQLDAHGKELMRQFHDRTALYERLMQLAYNHLRRALRNQQFYVTAIEQRLKTETSLARKLELKGAKYHSLDDVTDVVGLRVITFYTDDVDKVAVIVKGLFDVDWDESVDKRKLHLLNSFGYNSLHFICRLPKQVVDDANEPLLNELRFEIQMRTALQHVWSTIEHDTGYKGEVKMPAQYSRQFNRLAGMLELIDDEFGRLRTKLTDYRRQMQQLVASGQLNEVALTHESFRSFLHLRPFDTLNHRIAAVNQAELYPVPLIPFALVLQDLQLETLGDVQRLIDENSEDAYKLAISQLAETDIDIIAETIGIQNLCYVYTLKQGYGRQGLMQIFNRLYGKNDTNASMAERIIAQAVTFPFMKDIPV
ncbi:MAG: RelA/SpoT domain-containing protein [Prevotella sp.]|nr:RelA/SpoT domain-containing protein [Prevotella sp.]